MSVSRRFHTKKPLRLPAKNETKYVKQSGGRGQYAHVVLEIEPNEKGKGNEVVSKIVGGVIPREYIPAVIARCRRRSYNRGSCRIQPSRRQSSPSFSVLTTKLTPTRWRLRSADLWQSRKRLKNASRSC